MLRQFGSVCVAPWILFAQSSWNMDAVPVITAAHPTSAVTVEIRDRGGVFDPDTARRAREVLAQVHRRHRASVLIETVDSLGGAWIADVAGQRARGARAEQLYILVAGGERDVGVIAARRGPAGRLTDQQREEIRRAFLGPLQAGEADRALEEGTRAIGTTFDAPVTSPSKLNGREVLISALILVATLAVLIASRTGADAGSGTGEVAGPTWEPPRPRPSPDLPGLALRGREFPGARMTNAGKSLRLSRSTALCREKVEA